MKRLTEQVIRLQQAAEAVCTDKAFVYDTIYLAVIKTKQKYKKLANKERAVDVCISLMKQPKKHVKQSFSSVEDCIEKAMAAKIVPWKPILSAVAVVLAAVIVIPFCLPKEPTYVDPKGFVMTGAQTLANQVDGNGTVLQNFHIIPNLGAHDPVELAGVDMNRSVSSVGRVSYECITTSLGTTLLVQSYVNGTTKKAEFILYEAQEDGWHEVGQSDIRFKVQTASYGNDYNLEPIQLVADEAGNVFIISAYEDGVQIHQYSTNKDFKLVAQCALSKRKQIIGPYGIIVYTSQLDMLANYENQSNQIQILCRDEIDYHVYHTYLFTFDLVTGQLSEPHHAESLDSLGSITNLFASKDGQLYFSAHQALSNNNNEASTIDYSIFSYSQDSGLTEIINYGTFRPGATAKNISPYLLKVVDDKIHFVYKNGTLTDYVIYENGVELSRVHVQRLSTDSIEAMGFFFYDGTPYYLEQINNRYVALAQVADGKTVKIAEFELPGHYSSFCYTANHGLHLDASAGVVNFIIGKIDGSNPSNLYIDPVATCFF